MGICADTFTHEKFGIVGSLIQSVSASRIQSKFSSSEVSSLSLAFAPSMFQNKSLRIGDGSQSFIPVLFNVFFPILMMGFSSGFDILKARSISFLSSY